MSEIRKQKNKYQEELTRAPPLCGPASWLAHPAAGPAHLPPLSSSSRQREGSVAGARAPPRHATCSAACLPSPPRSLPRTTPRLPPALSHSPPALPSSPSLSLSHGRTPPSPPFAIAAISGHPSLPRLAQKLRHNSLFLPTAPRVPGSPASPPRRRSPLRAPTVVAVEFAVTSASPSPLTIPAAPR